jgi:predicted MPP superfamily phosphohydrolase
LLEAFGGLRIAQLSHIHIVPFTTAGYLRRCVATTNLLKPDLIVLTARAGAGRKLVESADDG